MYNINANELLRLAFNIRTVDNYKAEIPEGKKLSSDYATGESIEPSVSKRIGQNGFPISFPMKFMGGSYMKYDRDSRIVRKQMSDFDLPASSIASFQQAKIETRTRIPGGGTVKEMYGLDDWLITIRGVCIDDSAHPQKGKSIDQYSELVRFSELVDSIGVLGDFFELKNIFRLVIIDVKFPELPGMPDVHPFELRCRSDEPIELLL